MVFISLLMISCASALKAPEIYVRSANQVLTARATLREAQAAKPVLYFGTNDPSVLMYKIEYLTPAGKIPFLTVFKPKDAIKDTIRVAPCHVHVQALGGKKSKWSETLYIE